MPPKKTTTPSKPAAKGGAAKTTTTTKTAAATKSTAAKPEAAAKAQPPPQKLDPIRCITIKQILPVLMEGKDDALNNSGKWPLIIDFEEKCMTFLKYRDCNSLYAGVPGVPELSEDMNTDTIRRSVLGSLRYGKPHVVNIGNADNIDYIIKQYDSAQPGLMAMLLDKSILKEENFMKLVRDEDGAEYDAAYKFDQFMENFKFFVVTNNKEPNDSLRAQFYTIQIQE